MRQDSRPNTIKARNCSDFDLLKILILTSSQDNLFVVTYTDPRWNKEMKESENQIDAKT
jgi:hypothetical protein